jgi:ankyrin repeat protein
MKNVIIIILLLIIIIIHPVCPPDLHAKDSSEKTPLHLAVSHRHPAAVHALLNHGADTDARDAQGRTPLHLAAMYVQ